MANNGRSPLHADAALVQRLRACVAHAQREGAVERTLFQTVNEAVERKIAELERKYGVPKETKGRPRTGRPIRET